METVLLNLGVVHLRFFLPLQLYPLLFPGLFVWLPPLELPCSGDVSKDLAAVYCNLLLPLVS